MGDCEPAIQYEVRPVRPRVRCGTTVEGAGWGWGSGSGYWGVYAAGLCCCVFVVFFILVIISLSQSTQVQHHIHSLNERERLTQESTPESLWASSSSSFTALGATYHGTRAKLLHLCAKRTYHTAYGEANERLLPFERISIAELAEDTELQQHYFYHINIDMRMIFTTRSHHNKGGGGGREKKDEHDDGEGNRPVKVILLYYNVTSSFSHFSTIKLQELEFDTYDQSIKAQRNVILCSNNPFLLDAQRCDQLTKRGIMAIHGEDELTFIIPRVISRDNDTANAETILKDESVYNWNDNDNDGVDDNIQKEKELEVRYRERQKYEVIGLHMYNVVFYQVEHGETHHNNNDTRTHGTSSSSSQSYKERRVLSIEPERC